MNCRHPAARDASCKDAPALAGKWVTFYAVWDGQDSCAAFQAAKGDLVRNVWCCAYSLCNSPYRKTDAFTVVQGGGALQPASDEDINNVVNDSPGGDGLR